MNKILGAFSGLLAVGLVGTAAQAALTYNWSSQTNLKVTEISVENRDDASQRTYFLKFSAPTNGFTHNCSDTSGWWAVGGDDVGAEAMRSSATAAKLADRPVKIMWIGNTTSGTLSCTNGPGSGFPIVRGLLVQ